MTTTFPVANVKQNTETLPSMGVMGRLTYTSSQYAAQPVLTKAGEAFGANTPNVIKDVEHKHGLLEALHVAFDAHYPLVLSPDDIWLAIAQGFSTHVLGNSEALRARFLPGSQEGEQKDLFVEFDFPKGDPNNDWPSVFGEFGQLIGNFIGEEKVRLVRANFSTTGPIERAASEIVLMEAMSNYFTYSGGTLCGIPEITLLGTVEDWKDVVTRTQALAEFQLDWWVNDLVPTLRQFVAAAEGRPDTEFWQSIYKLNGGSGGPYVTGWVNQFFPYLPGSRRTPQNRFAFGDGLKRTFECGWGDGPNPDVFPWGLAKVPFTWVINGVPTYKMQFMGGFVGAHQDEDLRIRPSIGWVVRDAVEDRGETKEEAEARIFRR